MKSLQYLEVDVDAHRRTTFANVSAGVAVPSWTSIWGVNTTFVGIIDANFPSGKGGRLSCSASSRKLWTMDALANAADVSIYSLQRPRGASTQAMVVARASGSIGTEQGYQLAIQAGSSGLAIGKWVAGTFSFIATVAFTLTVDAYYWLRFDVITSGSEVILRGKAWQGEQSDEPDAWNIDTTDTSITSAGKVGLFVNITGHDLDVGVFQVRSYDVEDTFRFAVPTEYLPRDIECIPSITGISYNPAVISLGENLGQRATLNVTFKDHRHIFGDEPFDQGTFWGKWRGRFGQRLRARAVRWIQGLEGDALADMETRHFIVESTDGPTPDGTYSIKAQDVLKLADGDRAIAPRPTDAFLLANLTTGTTAFSVGPTGAGNLYFPASGYINIGGKEVCSFTRSGDAFTVVRNTTIPGFSYETEVVAHEAGERVQLCLTYTADDPADIIYDLLVNYAEISADYINLPAWQLETATFLQNVYTALIAEPTAVNKLASELIQQAALAVWWDSLAATLRLQVLRAISTTAEDFTEQNWLQGSLKVQDQPNTRLSEVLTYFAQRNPLKNVDEKDNFRSALLTIDLDAQSDYGGVANKTIFSRWIAFGGRTVAERLNNQLLGRFVDPPRRFNFDVWRHGPETVTEGGGYELGWTTNQDELGNVVLAPIQVTRLNPMPDKFSIEAEEMLFTTLNEVDLQNRVITIDSDINNVNLRDLHDNLYAEVDPSESPTVSVTFIVAANVIVGSTAATEPAMDVGDWPVGFTPTLKIFGRVQGAGGDGGNTSINPDTRADGEDGGTALYTRHALNLYVSTGEIWGGGGGGAGSHEGNTPGSGDDQWGGGGGAGRIAGSGGTCSGDGNHFPGQAGTSEEGGLGGQGEFFGLTPGRGGDPGEAGGDISPRSGGAAGNAIDGVSFITVVEGPGDIAGPQIN